MTSKAIGPLVIMLRISKTKNTSTEVALLKMVMMMPWRRSAFTNWLSLSVLYLILDSLAYENTLNVQFTAQSKKSRELVMLES